MDLRPIEHGGITINRLFDSETPVWAMLGRMADLAILSVLWTVCSIPIITMGAASAALMRCVLNMSTGQGNWRSRHFFRYFRRNLRNGTLLWLVFLLAAAVFIFDLVVLSASGSPAAGIQRIIAVIGMIIWMITGVWAFAMTSEFENGVFQTIKNAFYLGISWLPRTLLMSALWLVPAALLAFAPFILSRIIVLWPVLFWGGTAYFCSKLMIKPLSPYFDFELPEHPDEDENEEVRN